MAGYISSVPVPQAVIHKGTITATAGQTSFPVASYTVGYIDVWLNGVKLVDSDDYTATNGSDVVLTVGASAGDVLEYQAITPFDAVNQAFTGVTSVQGFKVNAVSIDDGDSPYTVANTDYVIYVDSSSGAVTVTLPALSGSLGRRITVRANAVTSAITIEAAGSDEITHGSLTSVTLSSAGDFWTFEAGPSVWELVDGFETISGTNDGIKRFDGTMEQWGYFTGNANFAVTNSFGTTSGTSYIADSTITFAVENIATPNVSVVASGFGVYTGINKSLVTLRIFSGSVADQTMWWKALGKWY